VTSRLKPVTFLTGGTGFLGSHIGAELLKRGEETYFYTRGNRKTTAADRLQNILDWHDVDRSLRSTAHLLEEMPEKLFQGIDRIIHCASDTSFSERKRQQVWAANVDFCEALVDFAVKARILHLIHISTAYVAGRQNGPCSEEPINNHRFYNVYEESKTAAELLLLDRCSKENIRLTIIRPSIVYGDSRTGRTLRFNALYYPVKIALFLKKIFEDDIREKGGEKAAEAGVSIEPDGSTRLPIRIEVQKNSGVNLIPIDIFINAFFALIDDSSTEGIYHIVNPELTRIEDIIDYVQKQFKLKGIQACGPEDFLRKPRNSLELLFERYLEAYSPYIKDTRIFLSDRAGPMLKNHGIVFPEFDKNMFHRCMSYAVSNDWMSFQA